MDDLDQNKIQTSELSPDVDAYINYHGLNGDPFDPDRPLFFTTAQLEKSLRLFNYLARFSRKLVVVTGVTGVGKTALLERFVNGLDEADNVCSFAALGSDSPSQVLLEIVEQLQVPNLVGDETLDQLCQAIRDYSFGCLERDTHCIVVIDDAELFTSAVLEQLYQLIFNESSQRCGISLLLCGEPDLINNVSHVVPTDVIEKTVFHQEIPTFSSEEVSKYLHLHFIENAGQSKAPFSQNECKAIFEQSQGLPRHINDAAKQVLLAGMGGLLEDDMDAKKKPKGLVVVLVGLLVAVGIGFLFWPSGDKPAETADLTEESLVGQIERVDELGQESTLEAKGDKIPVEPFLVEPISAEVVAEIMPIPEQVIGGDTEPEAVVVLDEEINDSDVQQSQEETVPKSAVELTAQSTSMEKQEKIEEVEARTVATHTLPESVVEAVPVKEQVSQIDVPAAPAEPSSSLAQHTARILAFKSTDYTMQMLGSQKKENLETILAKLPADNEAMYFEKTHKGAPWYVLIYGHYSDRAAANAAIADLPKTLKSYKPWIRRMSGIQGAIKANQ